MRNLGKYERLIDALRLSGKSKSEIQDIIDFAEDREARNIAKQQKAKKYNTSITNNDMKDIGDIVENTKLPVISIHYGDNFLLPFFPFLSEEGPCVLMAGGPLRYDTWDEVKLRFPKERYFNFNSDGQTRVEFAAYVQVPRLSSTVKYTTVDQLVQFLQNGNQLPVHEYEMPVVESVVSEATTVVHDEKNEVCYDLLKRVQSPSFMVTPHPTASVINISDVPIPNSFWMSRDGLSDLLQLVPGKGHSILRVRGIKLVGDSSHHEIDPEPPEIQISLQDIVESSLDFQPDDDDGGGNDALMMPNTTPRIVLLELLQEYVDVVGCTSDELDKTLETIKLLIQFPPQLLPAIKEHTKSLALTVGILIEEQTKTRFPQLSVPHGIFLLAQNPSDLIMLLQAWSNRNYIAHGKVGTWYDLPYFMHQWDTMLCNPGPYGRLYASRNDFSSIIDKQLRDWMIETGLVVFDSLSGRYKPGQVYQQSDTFVGYQSTQELIDGLVGFHTLPDRTIAKILNITIEQVRASLPPSYCNSNRIAFAVSRFGVSYGPFGSTL